MYDTDSEDLKAQPDDENDNTNNDANNNKANNNNNNEKSTNDFDDSVLFGGTQHASAPLVGDLLTVREFADAFSSIIKVSRAVPARAKSV
jgi:hypothetical protein